jgi:hypothetical protein
MLTKKDSPSFFCLIYLVYSENKKKPAIMISCTHCMSNYVNINILQTDDEECVFTK